VTTITATTDPSHELPRRFVLDRVTDPTGISGTGVVAWGVEFPDGTCVIRWATATRSTAVYGSLADVHAIHRHGGATEVIWVDHALNS
jgi:hypothetical protein